MLEKLRKVWHDPVWSKVIAAGILALVGAVWLAHKANWLPAMWNVPTVAWHGITVAWAYLLGTMPVWRWLFGLLLLVAGLFVVLLIAVASTFFPEKKNPFENLVPVSTGPDWPSYTTDTFYRIKWRWRYEGNEVTNLATFCPTCDYQMLGVSVMNRVSFHCDICKQDYNISESWNALRSIVPRVIHQKLRSGTYPKTSGDGQ